MKRTVHEFPIKGHADAAMLVSYGWRTHAAREGLPRIDVLEPLTSLLVRDGWKAAEWEPCHGPIKVHYRCAEGHKGSKASYVFPVVHDDPLSWSQMAVEENDLQGRLLRGDLAAVLWVLRRWASVDEDEQHPCPECRAVGGA